jgi:hypothetical protein
MKINYFNQSLKCCASCKYRIRNGLWELFCHEDKGPLDLDHLVKNIGLCSEYQEGKDFGYSRMEKSEEEK